MDLDLQEQIDQLKKRINDLEKLLLNRTRLCTCETEDFGRCENCQYICCSNCVQNRCDNCKRRICRQCQWQIETIGGSFIGQKYCDDCKKSIFNRSRDNLCN